jgi:hypothetical protein
MAKKKKKTSKKATPKAGPTVKQLQSAAKDMNTLMNDINNGNYASPIEMKDDVAYLTENIIGMVEKEMFKQDKDSLNVETIAVIEELGVKFESLADDPAQGGEEDGDGDVQKEKEEVKAEKKAPVEEDKPGKTTARKEKGKSRYGHTNDSMAALIDDLVFEGTTLQKGIKRIIKQFPDKDERLAKNKFIVHVNYLRKQKGIEIESTTTYKVKE